MRRQINILLIIIVTASLLGCQNNNLAVEEMGIISTVGVSYTDNQYHLTVQALKPMSVKENKPDAVVVETSTGSTTLGALEDLVITLGRKPLWTHLSVIIFDGESAKMGMLPMIDFFYRDLEPRLNALVLVTLEDMSKIFEAKGKLGEVPANQIDNSLTAQKDLNKAIRVELHDFLEGLMEPYKDPYLPLISMKEKEMQIFGTAIFKGDKLVETLDSIETKCLLRVINEIEGGLEDIKFKDGKKDKDLFITTEINSSDTKVKAIVDKGVRMEINIDEKIYISGVTGFFTLNQQAIKEIEQDYERQLTTKIEQVIAKIKKTKSNVLGFPQIINRENKDYWQSIKEDWDDIYPDLEVKVTVKAKVINNQLYKHNFYK